ncbi:MAG: class I SAM-dependent methyltransferase [Leptospirillia bacterium]
MMTFCEFMRQATSGPDGGYYTRHAGIGREGADFLTSPETSPAFATLLSLQIGELDRALGSPDPFYLIEAGPGNGTLMSDLLTIFRKADPTFFERVSPILCELPGVLEASQRERLRKFDLRHPPRWIAFPENSDPGPGINASGWPAPGQGLVMGNEFLDALPVHRLRVHGGQWEECYVQGSFEGGWEELWGDLSDGTLSKILLEGFGADLSGWEGQETEICQDLPRVLSRLDQCLSSGFMLWIDYGDIGSEIRSKRRRGGTLRAYRGHQVSDRLIESPGHTDLTAFVDFSRVARDLAGRGYRLEGYTDQMSWLIGLGFEEWIQANADRLSDAAIQEAATLVHPLRMGRVFKVLLMSKGVEPPGSLAGFRFGGLRSPL